MLRTFTLAVVLAVSTFFTAAYAADLPTTPTTGALVEKILATDPAFKDNVDEITQLIDAGANFAQDYILVRRSCDSPCQTGVAININTAKIIELPTAECEFAFDRESKTLIINPTPAEYTVGGVPMRECAHRRIYMLKNGKFAKFHNTNPRPLTNDEAIGMGYIVTINSD